MHWCAKRGHRKAAECLRTDWDRLVSYYDFPKEQWQQRTSNPVESPISAARLRTDAARRFKKVETATAVIWKIPLVAERAFRRVKHPEPMKGVYDGVLYADGLPVKTKAAA